MAPGVTASLWCLGIAVFLIVAGRIADWFDWAFLTSTTLWYMIATVLIVVAVVVLAYHASGVQVTTK